MATDNNTQPHVTDEMVNAATYAYMPFGDMYSALLAAFAEQPGQHQQPLRFQYTNWRGEAAERHVYPLSVRWGATEWHPDPCWLMRAYDLDKQAEREFAMASMAIAQVASGRTAGLEAERDALAAHVRRLEGQINRAPNIDGMYGEGCRCQSCGLLYVGDLVVPDDVWEVIKPDGKPPGAGMMCASCIMSRIRCRGLWSAGYAFDAAIVGAEPAAVEALAEKHDALAAHIERISAYKDHLEAKGLMPARMAGIIEEAPATSLARRDALKQAEALEGWFGQIRHMGGLNTYDCIESAELYAEELRRQAEGADTCSR